MGVLTAIASALTLTLHNLLKRRYLLSQPGAARFKRKEGLTHDVGKDLRKLDQRKETKSQSNEVQEAVRSWLLCSRREMETSGGQRQGEN